SVQLNSLSAPSARTSKIPAPRISRPVCSTTQRCGGSHSVMTIVSVKPTGPRPVQPVTLAPRPCPPRTRVAQTHSCCRDQSVAVRHTRSASAGTRTRATISSGLLTVTNLAEMPGPAPGRRQAPIRAGIVPHRVIGQAWPGPARRRILDCMVSQPYSSSRPPAPLDPAAVQESLRPFGTSRMLPRAAYVDPAVFAWERQHFFGDGWMCVGRSAQAPSPGDMRAEPVGEGSVLLARGEDGTLRAFANACRHRGHELLPCGSATQQKVIICPYHSWTYGLAGNLRAAAGFKNKPGFDASQWGLVELPVEEWHGLVIVDGSGQAGPLASSLGSLDPLIAPYEVSRLVVRGQHDYEVASNWKILTENYHECYHCPQIHPELCKVSPPKSVENYSAPGTWVGGWMDLRDGMATMSLDGTSRGVVLRN